MASFDENGKYIKTNWKAGDKITATKLNKIEESIEAVNDNDISRHVEADARLDALEAKDVAHDKELTNIKNTIANNKAAAELGDYDINSRMQFLEDDVEQAVNDMNNVITTIRNDVSEIQNDMTEYLPLSGGTITGDLFANRFESIRTVESTDGGGTIGSITKTQLFTDEYGQGRFCVENDLTDTSLTFLVNPHDRSYSINGDFNPAGGQNCNLGSATNGWQSLYLKSGVEVGSLNSSEYTSVSFYRYNTNINNQIKGSFGMNGDSDRYMPGVLYHNMDTDDRTGYNFYSTSFYAQNINNSNNGPDLGMDNRRWGNIYSRPFNMYIEDNSYTSRLKANRGNFRLVDGYDTTIFSWSHDYLLLGPDSTNQINLGSADYRFKTLYLNSQPNVSSDRTLKENIQYVNLNESNVSYEDMYTFVKDDLELATYNLVEHDNLSMGFIAQDLLVNLDGTDNKIGQMIVNPVAVPTEEEIEEGKPYPTLSYDMGMYISVLAGALKESINKIEQLEARIQELENK